MTITLPINPSASVRPLGEEHLRMFQRTVGSRQQPSFKVDVPKEAKAWVPELSIHVFDRAADLRTAMLVLDIAGLKLPTYQQIIPLLIHNSEFRKFLIPYHWFWVAGKGKGDSDAEYGFTVDKNDKFVRGMQKSSQENSVLYCEGPTQYALWINDDAFTYDRGNEYGWRYTVSAHTYPSEITKVIVGIGTEDATKLHFIPMQSLSRLKERLLPKLPDKWQRGILRKQMEQERLI